MEERAAAAGVLGQLKRIPDAVSTAAKGGDPDAKKAIQKIQISNQQIVSRAEKKMCQEADRESKVEQARATLHQLPMSDKRRWWGDGYD